MYKLGYTQGVFDMFHIGHLNLINHAKELCIDLMVGVNSDELVKNYKNKAPVINEYDRMQIVQNLKAVNLCEIVNTLDKIELYKKYAFDVVFIGDDWKGSNRWEETEKKLAMYNVPVIYLPHTPNLSSTMLREEMLSDIK